MIAFDYQIIRKNRKTASITISSENEVSVVVPLNLSQDRIDKIIEQKKRWIQEKLSFNLERNKQQISKQYVSGESFLYLGRNYRLKISTDRVSPIQLKNGKLHIAIPQDIPTAFKNRYIRQELQKWYIKQASKKIPERIQLYTKRIGKSPNKITIKTMKTQWGSCTPLQNISFHWKIIMAPIKILDYVVVHELCHLVHLNHSKDYWYMVETILPDYKERKQWLRLYGVGLGI